MYPPPPLFLGIYNLRRIRRQIIVPQGPKEYRRLSIEFIEARNCRIDQYAALCGEIKQPAGP